MTKTFHACAAVLILLVTQSAASQVGTDDAYLNGLIGDWVMTGAYGGKPVTYTMHGERVLMGGFVRLAMVDAAAPPQYEADMFIGYDPEKRDFIAHWLDRFGAAGARVVATGHRDGERLVVVFPYAEGAFRDTFVYDPPSKNWTLDMETQDRTLRWKPMAHYQITRR